MVGGPLPAEGKPISEPDAVKLGGEATDPERLRVVPTWSRAEAREDEPAEYEGVTPVNEGDEACDALVDAEFALGEDRSGWDGSTASRPARRGSMPYMADWVDRSGITPGEPDWEETGWTTSMACEASGAGGREEMGKCMEIPEGSIDC